MWVAENIVFYYLFHHVNNRLRELKFKKNKKVKEFKLSTILMHAVTIEL